MADLRELGVQAREWSPAWRVQNINYAATNRRKAFLIPTLPLCVLCVKAVLCVSAVKPVHSCSLSHAKRCIRADPFNPSNPRPKIVDADQPATTRAPMERE
jgi:hypothetical protein